MRFLAIDAFLALLSVLFSPLQTPAALPTTTAYQQVALYAGPGNTFRQTGFLNAGLEVRIIERNVTGIWVHIKRTTDDGTVAQDGWLISGYLNRDANLRFSEIPIIEDMNDSDPSTVNSRSMADLYAIPVIPTISDSMITVYQRGQASGNLSNFITKVGDSLSASPVYLEPMTETKRALGPYDYLSTTIDYYGSSVSQPSVAARIGMSSYSVLDPFWADKALCQPNETPLDCEYRLKRPSVAFIMFGPNDVRSMTDDKFAEQITMIVEDTLQHNIIPVLSTFSSHPDKEYFWQSVNFNLKLKTIADDHQIPLINLWSAARALPEFGLDQDRIHLKTSGFDYLKYDTGHEAFYGVSLHNLLSICTLDAIRQKLWIEVTS